MEGKASDWRPGPTVCRCCLTEGCYKDISTEYFWMGKREVYSEMLKETLDVTIGFSKSGGPNSNSRLICEPCISRLRDASEFKRQVLDCEKTFMHHLDPSTSSSSKARGFTLDTIGEVKVEVVKHEKESLSDDDYDDRPNFLDVDSDDDLDDQPLTKLASKLPKKEADDLLDLLDTSQITVKRKANLKLKTPPKKMVKKKEVVKPSASKAAPVKQAEKKKDEEWTTTDASDKVNTNSTPLHDEWITTGSKDTTQSKIKLESTTHKQNASELNLDDVTSDVAREIEFLREDSKESDILTQASSVMQTDDADEQWTISDTTNPLEQISDASCMEQNDPSDDEWTITDINKTPTAVALAKDKRVRSQRQWSVSVNQAKDDKLIWARVGQKWAKIDIYGNNVRVPYDVIKAHSHETSEKKYQITCAEENKSDVTKIQTKKKTVKKVCQVKKSNYKTACGERNKLKDMKIEVKNKTVRKVCQMSNSHAYCLPNARLMLQYTTAIPIRIQLQNIDVPCFACESKFKDPFEFREHFLAKHKNVDKTNGMHLYNTIQTRVDITDLACLLCSQSFGTLEEAARHLFKEHEINIDMEQSLSLVPLKFPLKSMYICWICEKKCMSFRDLYRHAGSHFTYHICEICGHSFEHIRALKGHLSQKHVDGHRCKMCRIVFSTSLELRQHVRGGCNSIKCKICKLTFGYSELLRKHRETIHGASIRTYKCLECEKVFEKRMQLYLHTKREHTDDYKCGSCGKRFTDSKSLRLHMLVHTGERPFKCHKCEQGFRSPSYHKIHVSKCKI